MARRKPAHSKPKKHASPKPGGGNLPLNPRTEKPQAANAQAANAQAANAQAANAQADGAQSNNEAQPLDDAGPADIAGSNHAGPNRDPATHHSPAVTVSTAKQLWPLIAVAHLVAIAISYLAIVEPSSTHSSILASAAPYLRSTHFAADGRRFYLAHGTPDEQPHRLQFATLGNNETVSASTNWETVQPSGIPGLASSDRYQRWMILAATLAESDQPSLAAALLLPLVQQDESINAIRVIRLPTELTTATEDSAPPPYVARVVRREGQTRLVSIQSKRLTTSPRTEEQSPTDAGDE